MATQADRVPLEQSAHPVKVAIVVALAVERACVDPAIGGSIRDVVVVQSGPGPIRAADAARDAVARGATAIVSFGLAGALVPELKPGTIVLPERVLTEDSTAVVVAVDWREALRDLLAADFALADGTLLSTAGVIGGPREKSSAAHAHGASACDMESAAIGAVATNAGVPFVALRVVADAVADRLPNGVAEWVDAEGNSRIGPLLAALAKPEQWRPICVLVRRFAAARRVLSRLAAHLAPVAFGQLQTQR
jgi:adenosylhomocysteine nucleosidase